MDATPTTASEREPPPTQSNRSEGFSFTTYLLSFAIALIFYVLSPGPVAKCVAPKGPPLPGVWKTVYAPIGFCCDRFPVINNFYEWYIKDVWQLP